MKVCKLSEIMESGKARQKGKGNSMIFCSVARSVGLFLVLIQFVVEKELIALWKFGTEEGGKHALDGALFAEAAETSNCDCDEFFIINTRLTPSYSKQESGMLICT